MKIPPNIKDLFPLEAFRHLANAVGQPQLVSSLKEAIEKVGGKDGLGATAFQNLFHQATRWMEAASNPWGWPSHDRDQSAGVNATGEWFSSRWTNSLVSAENLLPFSTLLSNPSDPEPVRKRLLTLTSGLTGATEAMLVGNSSSALAALGLGLGKEPLWVVPRLDCVRPFRFGLKGPSSLRSILDASGAQVLEIGSNTELERSDFDSIPTHPQTILLTCSPNSKPVSTADAERRQSIQKWKSQRNALWIEVLWNGSLHALNATAMPESDPTNSVTRLPNPVADAAAIISDRWECGADWIVVPTECWIGGPEGAWILSRKKPEGWNTNGWSQVQRVVTDLGFEMSAISQSLLLAVLRSTEQREGWERTPAGQFATNALDNLTFRANKIAAQIAGTPRVEDVRVEAGLFRLGTGVWGSTQLESAVIKVRPKGMSPSALAEKLLQSERPIWCNVQSDAIELVLRSVSPEDDRWIVQCLSEDEFKPDERTDSES